MTTQLGRPKVKDKREIYPLRLSKAEKKVYQAAADKVDIPLSKWIRNTLNRSS